MELVDEVKLEFDLASPHTIGTDDRIHPRGVLLRWACENRSISCCRMSGIWGKKKKTSDAGHEPISIPRQLRGGHVVREYILGPMSKADRR